MPKFKIEYGDKEFCIIAPNGAQSEDTSYTDVATIDYGGRVYAACLKGSEEEIDPGEDRSNYMEASQPSALVYDITDWPVLEPVPTETEAVAFDDEDDDDEPEPGPTVVS